MKFDIVRAWKDAEYRQSLSQQEQAQLPVSPVGAVELSEAELDAVHGACGDDCGGGSSSSSSSLSAINSLTAAACVNSTGAAGFCITYGVGCGL